MDNDTVKPSSLNVAYGNAICYSGYRENQSPRDGLFPSYEQILEDLLLLAPSWKYLRLYDCSRHAELVIEVIEKEGLDFELMLGVDMLAEVSNPNCPWGAFHTNAELATNQQINSDEIDKLISLANCYSDIVFSVSVANESSVEWTDHLVPVEHLVDYAKRVKAKVKQPVTFCENYVPWTYKLAPLAKELDFICMHTYPVWEYKSLEEAMDYTKQNYNDVVAHNPGIPVVITEAGWTTASNGRGIEPHNASQELQASYCRELVKWSREEEILTFVFEAFDEPWKGSSDPLEPEKHWGLYTVDRKPKLVMEELFSEL